MNLILKFYSSFKIVFIFETVKTQLVYLGVPLNLRKFYNLGFILGVCLGTQIVRGLFLAIIFIRGIDSRFSELFKIQEYTGVGLILRYIHINTVSFFFIYIYIHIGRGLYYGRYLNKNVWLRGVSILLLVIATAFIGYVLPNNQISFWGASVITRLVREVPYLGKDLVEIIWGRVRVCKFTLVRFFTLHFILPFIVAFFIVLHIIFLHDQGSRNPLGLSRQEKITFKESQGVIDRVIFFFFLRAIFGIVIWYRNIFGDDQNFLIANLIETPPHIQPEWYFLFAYAILRSIPNKLGGVIGLGISIAILYFLPFLKVKFLKSLIFKPVFKIIYWCFIVNIFLLSWMGICRVEHPYVLIGQIFSILYFLYFIIYFFTLSTLRAKFIGY